MELEDHVFTVNREVIFHDIYDLVAACLEGFSSLNLLSFFHWDYKARLSGEPQISFQD